MTRGHRDSLDLRCRAFSSPTPCRFIPALSSTSHSTPETRRLDVDRVAGEIVAAELPCATAYLAGAGGSAATSLLDCLAGADSLTRDQAPLSRAKKDAGGRSRAAGGRRKLQADDESCRRRIESCTPPAGPFRRSECHIPDRAGHPSVTARAAPEAGARSTQRPASPRRGIEITRGKGTYKPTLRRTPARLTSTSTSLNPRKPPAPPSTSTSPLPRQAARRRLEPPRSSPQTAVSALPPPVPSFLFRCSQRFLTGQT